MTRYSLEPPRTNLVAYHTFDDVDNDRVIDHSPQANDGAVVGDVTFGYTGVVGSAARMKDDGNNVAISGLSSFLPMAEVTSSVWGRSENVVATTDNNVSATLETSNDTITFTHSIDEPTTAWQFATLRYDGSTAELWYANDGNEPRAVQSTTISGDVQSFDVTVFTNGYGFVDDVRVYRTALMERYVRNLHEMATAHVLRDEVGAAWPTPGLPYRGQNSRFAGTLTEAVAANTRELDAMLDARRIQTAAGEQLDRIGRRFGGITRKTDEEDDKYRRRIIGRVVAARSSGTFADILSAAATVIGTDENRITLDRQQPVTAVVTVKEAVIDQSVLTAAEVENILQDAVVAGHDLTVQTVGGTPFTIKASGDVDDPSRGLTSDSISTGGVLVSDAQ